MCGIAGVFHRDRQARVDIDLVRNMTELLMHRGPDDGGVVRFGPAAFGHRRLSILDLSPLGHQPMATADRRYWITFNGEIYNYQALRAELEAKGIQFRTRTDTEVLLYLFREEGERCVERLNGMFAFGIYDVHLHTLFLARDRLGKKPLYLWDDGQRILFSSELKSFFADPHFQPEVEPQALVDFMYTLYVPDPRTIYAGVEKLPPAHTLKVTRNNKQQRRYWFFPQATSTQRGPKTVNEAVEAFQPLFADAVRLRMISDVPLGAFLSGGVDSSAVVSEMRRQGGSELKTTAIGFDVASQDESPYAEAVARHFDCDHRTERVHADAAGLLETLLWHFDEPFADASALPTWLLSEATRKRVTVALSGDGGDEAFGGYDKYRWDQRERLIRSKLPGPLWSLLAKAASTSPLERLEPWRRGANFLRTLADSPESAYFRTQSFTTPEQLDELLDPGIRARVHGYDASQWTRRAFGEGSGRDPLAATQWVDITTYLPGDILTKVDRMSMGHALEVRCPLLDYRVIEFALALPSHLRLHEGNGKPVLKRLLEQRLPASLVDRPKHGFTVPVEEWFRGPLVPMVQTFVQGGALKDAGVIRPAAVERMLKRHQSGERNQGMELWILLVLGVWYERIRGRAMPKTSHGVPARVEDLMPELHAAM